MKRIYWRIALSLWLLNLTACINSNNKEEHEAGNGDTLILRQAEDAGTISVYREGSKKPILVQNAKAGFRPFIHPIAAPDGKANSLKIVQDIINIRPDFTGGLQG